MRQPTITMTDKGFSLSKRITEKLGDTLNFMVDPMKQEIIINREPGQHMAMVNYPSAQPVIHCKPLTRWIKKELGERDFSKMPVEWDEEERKFIVKPGVKA